MIECMCCKGLRANFCHNTQNVGAEYKSLQTVETIIGYTPCYKQYFLFSRYINLFIKLFSHIRCVLVDLNFVF